MNPRSNAAPISEQDLQLEDFLALSRLLTGVEHLNVEIGRQYLERLKGTPFGPTLGQVLERCKRTGEKRTASTVKQLLDDATLRPTICQIILLWFTSAMQDNPDDPKSATNMRYGTQEEYFSGLGWQVIGAHVPGLSGGYFGHWRYRPDNEPKR